jgi:DNA-binding NarL/FixJ family response regulator
MRPTTILLADDHPLVRAGIRRVLETEPELRIVGEASDGEKALALVEELDPEIVILDLAMPGLDGLELLRRTQARRPRTRVIVLTMHASPEYVLRAIRDGAHGYLLKESAAQDLLAAIRTVRAGGHYHSAPVQALLAEAVQAGEPDPVHPLDRLTEREREVLREIAAGYSTKQVAARLGIGVRTVESHRASLMRKLDLHSVARLTQFALREGLLP